VQTFVSTGTLPPAERVRALVDEAHERYRSIGEGAVSDVYPALARVPPELFGIGVAAVTGDVHAVGDAEHEFAIMSVAKPFVFALVCQELGPDEIRDRIGMNATGLPFNSPVAVEQSADGRTNPMVNPGAIATVSLVSGPSAEARWQWVVNGLSLFAGRELALDVEVYRSASETNHRNRDLARLLESRDRLYCDSSEAVDRYTRQSCLSVSAKDLAAMGATLADGGVNPVTGVQVIDAETCRHTLAVMATAGLYETSGDWLHEVGLPGKSGIGGGIVTVAPGKGGLGTFAPPLDAAGNSVKGKLAATFLSHSLGMHVFASNPA
jgi:glutaminase